MVVKLGVHYEPTHDHPDEKKSTTVKMLHLFLSSISKQLQFYNLVTLWQMFIAFSISHYIHVVSILRLGSALSQHRTIVFKTVLLQMNAKSLYICTLNSLHTKL